jgi:hypothetical protein
MTPPGRTMALSRGALVTSTPAGVQNAISFQYNPETLRRTIEPNVVGGKPGSRSRAVRFAGAAVETITVDCRFSASDAGPGGDQQVAGGGIAPQLAALALLSYPTVADVQAAQDLLDNGQIEVIPPLANELLFVFGSRVVPCEIQSLSVVEQLFDASLTPVIATVTLTLRTMTYSDVTPANPAYNDFVTYQTQLEALASTAYDSSRPRVP